MRSSHHEAHAHSLISWRNVNVNWAREAGESFTLCNVNVMLNSERLLICPYCRYSQSVPALVGKLTVNSGPGQKAHFALELNPVPNPVAIGETSARSTKVESETWAKRSVKWVDDGLVKATNGYLCSTLAGNPELAVRQAKIGQRICCMVVYHHLLMVVG